MGLPCIHGASYALKLNNHIFHVDALCWYNEEYLLHLFQ